MKPLRKHRYTHKYLRLAYKRIMREEDKKGKEYTENEFKDRLTSVLYKED